MATDVRVRIENEAPRTFTNLSAALDYAATRVRPERAVSIVDIDFKEYLLLRRSADFTITLTREV